MNYNRKNRKSNRWQGYDYSREGSYFITICTKDKIHYFGEIRNKILCISEIGQIVFEEWKNSISLRANISLGKFVVMPNHIHAIVFIDNQISDIKDDIIVEYKNKFGKQTNNISSIIRGFKGACTRKISEKGYNEFRWQSGFHDRVIRNFEELIRIENYILSNTENWEKNLDNILAKM